MRALGPHSGAFIIAVDAPESSQHNLEISERRGREEKGKRNIREEIRC